MSLGKVLDAAYPRWTIAQLQEWKRSHGLLGVMSYVSWLPNGKVITRDRFAALEEAGIDQGLVWESTGTDFTGGYSAGLKDGTEARRQANLLGFPAERPIYSTIDVGAHASAIATEYQHGFDIGSGVGAPGGEGFYGDRELALAMRAAGVLDRFYWETNARAWPGDGVDDAAAVMIQRTSKSFPLPPGSYDESDVFARDWGQHPAPTSAPVPKPSPPISIPMPGGPDMDYTRFEQTVTLDDHGDGHVPIPGVLASAVFSWGAIATPDPAKVGHYVPAPNVSLTIGQDGHAELILEGGLPNGPASVRACHT